MNFQQDDNTNQTFGRPSGMNNLRRRSNRNNGSLVDKIKDSFAPRKGSLKNWAKETAAYGFALYCATIPHQFIRVPQETEFPSNT